MTENAAAPATPDTGAPAGEAEAPILNFEIPEAEGQETPPEGQETEGEAPGSPAPGEEAGAAPEGGQPGQKPQPPEDREEEIEFKGEKFKVPVSKMKSMIVEAEGKVEEANEALAQVEKEREEIRTFVGEMRQDFTMGAYRVLLDKHQGDEGKAWGELVERCRLVVQRDDEWKKMPEPERQALLARRDADRYKREADDLRGKQDSERQSREQAEATEAFLRGAVPLLKEAKLPVSRQVLLRLNEIYEHNRKAGRPVTQAAAVKLLKDELTRARSGLQKDAIASMDVMEFIKAYPEFAKQLVQAGIRISRQGGVRSGAAGGAPNGAAAAPGKASPTAKVEDTGPIVMSTGSSTSRFFRELDAKTQKRPKR